MYKRTTEAMQHRARHPGRALKFSGLPGQRQRAAIRVAAFRKILAAELQWQTIKLPLWLVSEIRTLGIRRWLDVQHRRIEDAAAATMLKVHNPPTPCDLHAI